MRKGCWLSGIIVLIGNNKGYKAVTLVDINTVFC